MFQTHTREHKTPLTVQAYADENKTNVVAHAEGIGRVVVAVSDLAHALPPDLPTATQQTPTLPPALPPDVKATVEQHAPVPPPAEVVPEQASVPSATEAPSTPPPAAETKPSVKKTVAKKVVAAAKPSVKADPNLPASFGGRGRPRALHVMVQGVFKKPLLGQEGGNEKVALQLAHEHGVKNVHVSCGEPPIPGWMPFATYIKKRDSLPKK